jgi:small subunit ribosomal protein S2
LTRVPAALFVVDISKEHIAVAEGKKLGIPIFAIVDTNSNPEIIDFPIPANDDASKSISIIIEVVTKAISEGIEERKMEREKEREEAPIQKPKSESKAKRGGQRKARKTENLGN